MLPAVFCVLGLFGSLGVKVLFTTTWRLLVTFGEFWPEYVGAHSRPATRIFHTIGTLFGWILLDAALATRHLWWIAIALVVPYALAWISHFFVQHNKPASFEHPLWSWWADQRMVFLTLAGRMDEEVQRCLAQQETVRAREQEELVRIR